MPDTENWLLIIKPESHQILAHYQLESIARIFVRNNDKFLYFGTHSWEGTDGLKKWVLKGFDLRSLSWLTHPRMYLVNMAGSDIGSTVCFEIFGDYFYGLSNQSLFEADDPEWASHYYCFRFPLNEPRLDKFEKMTKDDSWRRYHSEGPIDDRWGFLSLETDERSGSIVILECRKEWLKGQRGSQRTYYTTDVIFRQGATEEPGRTRQGTTRRVGDHPQPTTPVPLRSADRFHAGDDTGSTASLLVRSKTYFCAYIRCCETYIDLIDETPTETPGPQRLRLRTGYRRFNPSTKSRSVPSRLALATPSALSEPYKPPDMQPRQTNTIFIWPPKQGAPGAEQSMDRAYQLFNVDGDQTCVGAAGDERSMIYATSDGSKAGVKALVFVSFDPAVQLEGMEFGGHVLGQRMLHDEEEGASDMRTKSDWDILQFSPPHVPLGAITTTKCSKPGRSITALSCSSVTPSLPPPEDGRNSWASYTKAMHLDIPRKLYFGR
ncbi:hypothetical protein ONZ43_g6632 [Nemania bipapillata]|uniref:Uncharacterized protein n=1 Tax=Nemania bipapillata TaxID=110536 RepID=A0ACC2HY93_9PEZI|nr:hypothetical protein ONZ43_g6632 [Nemania bipapillata]